MGPVDHQAAVIPQYHVVIRPHRAQLAGGGVSTLEHQHHMALGGDDLDLKTNVSIENSELKAEESITVDALTGDAGYNPDGEPVASVDKEVTIKYYSRYGSTKNITQVVFNKIILNYNEVAVRQTTRIEIEL